MVKSAIIQQRQDARFTFTPSEPKLINLPGKFDAQMKSTGWKEKKQALENASELFEPVQDAKCNFDLNQLSMQCKLVFDNEINAIVVGNTYRLLGQIAAKCGTLGSSTNAKLLIQSAINRVKERKYAITQGFQIFSSLLLVKIHFKNWFSEYFNVALGHKNNEVKEDLCRFLKSVYATSTCYVFCSPELQNERIKALANDYFPNPQYLNTEEEIPLEGERSYGMQIGPKLMRQRSCQGAVFCTFFVNGVVNENPVIYKDQIIAFVQMLDKLLNDINEPVRQIAKRTLCLFVVAHLSEGWDAVQRSNSPAIMQANQEVFSIMYDVVHQNSKRGEILKMIQAIFEHIGIVVFN